MHTITNHLINLSEQVAYSEECLQHKIIFESGGQKTILMAFTAGQGLPEHKTPKPALLVMLEGICEFTIFDSPQLLREGEIIEIPARELHHLHAITDFKMLLLK